MEKLYRDDTTISIDRIETNLYLGNLSAAKNIATLKKFNITHILTIDNCPLPQSILAIKHLKKKYIELSDHPKVDLLSHFDDTYDFIAEGLANGAVLVHCYFGISRSATVVLAFTMKKYQQNFTDALKKVKSKRVEVRPNQGFVIQLNLYHKMGFKVDLNYMDYKIFRLNIAADLVIKACRAGNEKDILPQAFMSIVKVDPGLTCSRTEGKVYRCKQCRRVLASDLDLITHKKGETVCKELVFIEPLAWMSVTHTIQETLHCPKCKVKVGSFSWIKCCKCPCGTNIAPAINLIPSKISSSLVETNKF